MASNYSLTNGEFGYADYQKRQYEEVQPEALLKRATQVKFGNKFQFIENSWQPIPYRGYAIVSMVKHNPGNELLVNNLVNLQEQLLESTGLQEKLFPLPASSFHQTVANTLSSDRFNQHILQANLEAQYPSIIEKSFEQIELGKSPKPLCMKLIGLSIFHSAMGILGVFEEPEDFDTILNFREQIYSNPTLNELDIRRTRPFVGHLTLFYFERNITPSEANLIAEKCIDFNQSISASDWSFLISNTQLRTYPHLASFEFHPGFPTFSFIES